jgi:hypothetical protein
MTTARYVHTAVLLPNGKVLVAGGVDAGGNVVATAELYDPVAGTWSATGSLSAVRYLHNATLAREWQGARRGRTPCHH